MAGKPAQRLHCRRWQPYISCLTKIKQTGNRGINHECEEKMCRNAVGWRPGQPFVCADAESCKTGRSLWRKIQNYRLSAVELHHSGIDTVGVLTQYEPLELNAYIGNGATWDLDCMSGGAYVLPPYVKGKKGEWYSGTASAIYQNIHFIEQYDPEYILILSGDHIYTMDYEKMIDAHEKKGADATIAVMEVPMAEASRIGIMNTNEEMRIVEFEEKPPVPKNNLASMGIYVFTWSKLKEYLIADNQDPNSSNDFGKNIIRRCLITARKCMHICSPVTGKTLERSTVCGKQIWTCLLRSRNLICVMTTGEFTAETWCFRRTLSAMMRL